MSLNARRRRTAAREFVSFALPETSNMLAAWGTRGVAGDIVRARALYRKALNLGLEALK